MSRALRILPILCLILPAAAVRAADEDVADDERLLRSCDFPVDGPGLLDAFRQRTPSPEVLDRVRQLLRRCGSENFEERERASADLLALGPRVRPLLRLAQHDRDPEIARRAADVVCWLERPVEMICLEAAVRLLAHHRTDGSTAVLLDFLPYVEETTLADEIALALARNGVHGGKPDPALVAALADRQPLTRAVAAEALTRGGVVEQRDAVRKLLADPDAAVRERVALALLDERDRAAVPALIRLVGELPSERRYAVEAALHSVAGDKAPQVVRGDLDEERRERLAAWEEWWKNQGDNLQLPKVEPGQRLLGHTVVTMLDQRGRGQMSGRVFELDPAGQIRWEIAGLRYPVDAQVLGVDRVLITEYSSCTVTERNLRGEVLWSKTLDNYVLSARRQRDGRTVIVSRSQIVEVDRSGKETELLARAGDIAAAVRLRNRQMVVVTTGGNCVRYDETGKELGSFNLGGGTMLTPGSSFDVLPNGNILVPLYYSDKVVEFDATGKQVWEASATYPSSAQRLPNGNTLVCNRGVARFGRTSVVVELDREGQQVWQYQPAGRPVKAQRR
jgi:outer membrane protein assembly factor BamB